MITGKTKLTAILTAWIFAVGVGVVSMTDYATRPGAEGISPADFSLSDDGEQPRTLRPTLLVFAHPYCPCSRATFAELARLNERVKDAVNIKVFFYQPPDQSREWVESALWREAAAIPNASVEAAGDTDLEKFGALTSGQVILYGTDNRLVFSGGITRARGHEGDNDGRTTIESFLAGKSVTLSRTPVFGCALNSPPDN